MLVFCKSGFRFDIQRAKLGLEPIFRNRFGALESRRETAAFFSSSPRFGARGAKSKNAGNDEGVSHRTFRWLTPTGNGCIGLLAHTKMLNTKKR